MKWQCTRAHQKNLRASPARDIPYYVRSHHRLLGARGGLYLNRKANEAHGTSCYTKIIKDQRKTKNEAHAFCLDNIFSSWVSVRVTSQYHEKNDELCPI